MRRRTWKDVLTMAAVCSAIGLPVLMGMVWFADLMARTLITGILVAKGQFPPAELQESRFWDVFPVFLGMYFAAIAITTLLDKADLIGNFSVPPPLPPLPPRKPLRCEDECEDE